MLVVDMMKRAGRFASQNSPTILTAVATAGVITTAVLAVRSTPRAYEIAKEMNPHGYETLDAKEKWAIVKATWTCYIPAIAVGVGTIACVIGANTVHLRRTAALASAYSLLERAANAYEEKVLDVIGKKKDEEIRTQIAQDTVTNNPPSPSNVVIPKSGGDTRFYESTSGRYFDSDYETVRRAENDLNYELMGDTWLGLNRVYEELGLDATSAGDWLGWRPETKLEFAFHAVIDDDGRPCIVINYAKQPTWEGLGH